MTDPNGPKPTPPIVKQLEDLRSSIDLTEESSAKRDNKLFNNINDLDRQIIQLRSRFDTLEAKLSRLGGS